MKLLQNIIRTSIIALIVLSMISCQKENITTNDPETTNPESDNSEQPIIKIVNDIRSQGCNCGTEKMPPAGPVTWSNLLEDAAREHCLDMYNNDFFSHDGSGGSTFIARINKTGFKWTSCAENIAKGYTTEEQVINAWLNSPGHCKNIMNNKFKFMGVARSGSYWTQEFAGQ